VKEQELEKELFVLLYNRSKAVVGLETLTATAPVFIYNQIESSNQVNNEHNTIMTLMTIITIMYKYCTFLQAEMCSEQV
jgi:hypothetical protein